MTDFIRSHSTRHESPFGGKVLRLAAKSMHRQVVGLGRSFLARTSPNVCEERFAWGHLALRQRILDVGSGQGCFIASYPNRVIGTDHAVAKVSHCRSRGFNVIQADPLSLPFANDTFDGVHSAQLIFQFEPKEAVRYLSELVRVARPGGLISLSALCHPRDVFDYPEAVRPYPPQAIFRMIDLSRGASALPGAIIFKAISFRRPPLLDIRACHSPSWHRAASLLNALQFACYLQKYWTYRGYTIILEKSNSTAMIS